VYFWERPTDERVPAELIGFRSEEYEIAEANDVRDVLAWAESYAGPTRTFAVHVLVNGTLIRLFGRDPTSQ
jgi:hypothetical protein